MEVIVGKKAGFCPGVSNTVRKAEKELKEVKPLYCMGEIIHNPLVLKKLGKKGLKIINSVEEIPNNEEVLIRAHGVAREVYNQMEEKGLKILDLTCPKVLAIHKQIDSYAKKGYYILILGEKQHPEIIGSVSFGGENIGIIEEQLDILPEVIKINESRIRNVAILSQTTFSMSKFDKFVEAIKRIIAKDCNVEVNKTICDATKLRQIETIEIAKQVDLMIILGGANSSNTQKLYDIGVEYCSNAMRVGTLDELYLNYIRRFRKVGVMAGASTPEDMIKKVVKILEETETEDCIE